MYNTDYFETNLEGLLSVIQRDVHETSIEHGFWDDEENKNIPTKLMLMVSELSEALEAWRKSDMDNFGEELADTVIRILDTAEYLNIPLQHKILEKAAFNKSRPYKHGGKRV